MGQASVHVVHFSQDPLDVRGSGQIHGVQSCARQGFQSGRHLMPKRDEHRETCGKLVRLHGRLERTGGGPFNSVKRLTQPRFLSAAHAHPFQSQQASNVGQILRAGGELRQEERLE